MEELESLASLSPEDLSKCTALLGKEQLSSNQSNAVWRSFVQVYGGAENIPEDQLQQMGWVINGIPPAHFGNLSLTDVDTIASFGRCRELSPQQLENLKNAISEQWLGKDLEDFSSFDLIALRQVLCAYNSSLIQMIHPDAYKDAAPELATIANCTQEVLKELARLAVDEQAFGDPHAWTSVQAGSVGCVMAGLPAITDVPPDAFEGLTADIIDCMPTDIFHAMTTAQIARLSPSAAAALTRKRITLSGDKKYALQISGSSKAALKSASEQLLKPSSVVVIGLTTLCIGMYLKAFTKHAQLSSWFICLKELSISSVRTLAAKYLMNKENQNWKKGYIALIGPEKKARAVEMKRSDMLTFAYIRGIHSESANVM